ncbi:MAG: glycosyltransferase family 4 protein [Vicinamibacterales bacterium]
MRILHWTESFWPRIGGAERFVQLLSTEQRRRGHKVLVISDTAESLPPEDSLDDVAIERLPFQAALASRELSNVVGLAREITARIRLWKPDLVHLHTSQPGAFYFLRMQKALKLPTVYTTNDPQGTVDDASPLLAEIFEAVQAIVAISPFMLRDVIARAPAAAAKSRCIVYGLPWPEEPVVASPSGPPTILAVGRVTPSKGFDVLVRAMHLLRRTRPDARLVVAGDGDARPELERLVGELDLWNHVRFDGWASPESVRRGIDSATVIAVPSRWQEPFGLVALEAMQRGRPVVASNVGGLAEVVRDSDTGILVPPEDEAALAAALERVLADRALAAALGGRGLSVARVEYDWLRCADAYNDVYRACVG